MKGKEKSELLKYIYNYDYGYSYVVSYYYPDAEKFTDELCRINVYRMIENKCRKFSFIRTLFYSPRDTIKKHTF